MGILNKMCSPEPEQIRCKYNNLKIKKKHKFIFRSWSKCNENHLKSNPNKDPAAAAD